MFHFRRVVIVSFQQQKTNFERNLKDCFVRNEVIDIEFNFGGKSVNFSWKCVRVLAFVCVLVWARHCESVSIWPRRERKRERATTNYKWKSLMINQGSPSSSMNFLRLFFPSYKSSFSSIKPEKRVSFLWSRKLRFILKKMFWTFCESMERK